MHKLLEQQLRQWLGEQTGSLPGPLVDALDTTYRQAETEIEELRQEIRRARELEAIGRVAGGIAHDYNNLLTVIKGYCDLCLRLAPEDSPLGGGLAQISQATERAADMTRQLLALSRRKKTEDADWDVHRVMEDMAPSLRRLLDGDQTLHLHPEAGDALIHGDRGRLQQLLLNLVIQLHEGLGSGAEVHLRTSGPQAAPPPGFYHPEPISDSRLVIHGRVNCSDPGPRRRGLAVLSSLVGELGGGLRVEDDESFGISVALPLKSSAPVGIESPGETGEDTTPRTRILVVEDEEPVRFMLEALLTDQGHQVTLSPGPKDALQRFGARGDAFDLLITDIVMPDMYGPEMAEIMRRERPDLPVLFISGYDPAARERRGAPAPGGAFLQKPFDAATLGQKIKEVLKAH